MKLLSLFLLFFCSLACQDSAQEPVSSKKKGSSKRTPSALSKYVPTIPTTPSTGTGGGTTINVCKTGKHSEYLQSCDALTVGELDQQQLDLPEGAGYYGHLRKFKNIDDEGFEKQIVFILYDVNESFLAQFKTASKNIKRIYAFRDDEFSKIKKAIDTWNQVIVGQDKQMIRLIRAFEVITEDASKGTKIVKLDSAGKPVKTAEYQKFLNNKESLKSFEIHHAKFKAALASCKTHIQPLDPDEYPKLFDCLNGKLSTLNVDSKLDPIHYMTCFGDAEYYSYYMDESLKRLFETDREGYLTYLPPFYDTVYGIYKLVTEEEWGSMNSPLYLDSDQYEVLKEQISDVPGLVIKNNIPRLEVDSGPQPPKTKDELLEFNDYGSTFSPHYCGDTFGYDLIAGVSKSEEERFSHHSTAMFRQMNHADLLLNFVEFSDDSSNGAKKRHFASYKGDTQTINIDFYHTVLHELGHMLGLEHDSGKNLNIMDPVVGVDSGDYDTPSCRDQRRISCLHYKETSQCGNFSSFLPFDVDKEKLAEGLSCRDAAKTLIEIMDERVQ